MLSIQGLTRTHGSQKALNSVSFSAGANEVIGIVDREGLGILELVAILSGQTTPDSGQVWLDGRRLQWPFSPQKQNIGILYREPEIVGAFDIASNIFLGCEIDQRGPGGSLGAFSTRRMFDETMGLIGKLNFNLPMPYTRASNLSAEQRQLVSIIQLVVRKPQLIVIDNPSRTLSLPYQEQLLDLIHQWQAEHRTVIFSSSNLDYLFAVCDRIIVLREGRVAVDSPADRTRREDVVSALVGDGDRMQITPVIWALDSYYQALRQAELLRHNKALLEQDLARQDTINQQLLEQLSIQVNALDRANFALQQAQRRLLTEREQERKHLARELHDQMIQDLLTSNYQLEALIEGPGITDEIRRRVDDVRHSMQTMVDDLRQICGKLRPPTIDSFGLSAALTSYTSTWSDRTGIEVILDIDPDFRRLSEEIELSLFRIVQEGLSNVRKHSQASKVWVMVHHPNPRMLHLSIADNGVGLDDQFDLSRLSEAGHYGLLGITERVALMGGRINFRNHPEGGLLIQVEVPHPRTEGVPVF